MGDYKAKFLGFWVEVFFPFTHPPSHASTDLLRGEHVPHAVGAEDEAPVS